MNNPDMPRKLVNKILKSTMHYHINYTQTIAEIAYRTGIPCEEVKKRMIPYLQEQLEICEAVAEEVFRDVDSGIDPLDIQLETLEVPTKVQD